MNKRDRGLAEESRQKSSFWQQVRGAFRYLKESRNYIYAIALIFLAGGIIGFAMSDNFKFLDEILKELVGKIEGLGFWGTLLFILQNNIKSALFGLVLGVLLGIFPVINAISNGIVLGYVMKLVFIESGVGEMWRLIPHGIFEIPAIFISLAMGFKLGMFIFSRDKKKEFFRRARNGLIIFVFVAIPLLILAAFIESWLIMLYK